MLDKINLSLIFSDEMLRHHPYLKFLPHFIIGQFVVGILIVIYLRISSQNAKRKQAIHVSSSLDYLQKLFEEMSRSVEKLEQEYDAKRLYCSNGIWERLNELRSYREAINARFNDMDHQAGTLNEEDLSDAFASMLAAPLNVRLN